MNHILNNFSILFIFSLLLNIALFSFIKLGFLGKDLKSIFNHIIYKYPNLFIFLIFIVSFIILVCLKQNVIFLEEEKVVVTTTLKEGTFVISGELLNSIFTNLGSAAVFSAGAKIAASLVAKHPMHLLPKTGIIGGTAAGFTATFRLVNHYTPGPVSGGDSIVHTGPVEIKVEGIQTRNNQGIRDIIQNNFGNISHTSQMKSHISFKEEVISNIHTITGNLNETSKVISELEKVDPHWRDKFIHSPLEINTSLTKFVLEVLNDHLLLNFIIIYLLIMLLLIFISKFVLNKNTKFNNLNKYPLGNLINKFLVKVLRI